MGLCRFSIACSGACSPSSISRSSWWCRGLTVFSAGSEAGVPTYETPEDAVRGFMHLVRWQRSRAQLMQTPPSVPDSFRPDRAAAEKVIGGVRASGRRLLTGSRHSRPARGPEDPVTRHLA